MGTDLRELPQDLVDAASDELCGYGPTSSDICRAVAATIDWLREHPACAARLLGTRTPTSWDV